MSGTRVDLSALLPVLADTGRGLGVWLDAEMPNPVLPEPQRWDVKSENGKWYLVFANPEDATMFTLRWAL